MGDYIKKKILDVFQVFQTAILGQKIRRRSQTQLRGVALEKFQKNSGNLAKSLIE